MEDLPEEIVAEILRRLQPTHLFRCKQVSKRWKSFISNPDFGRNYLKQASSSISIKSASSSSCHLVDIPCPYENWIRREFKMSFLMKLAFLTFDGIGEIDEANYNDQPPFRACIVPHYARIEGGDHTILASSSGLILSSTNKAFQYNLVWKLELCVSNPLTNQSVQLPLLKGPFSHWNWGFGFATRPGRIGGENAAFVTYRVVFIQEVIGGSLDFAIDIFSSDTGNWTGRKLVRRCSSMFFSPTVANALSHKGILHWFDRDERNIVTYDPYDTPDRFGHIGLPNGGSDHVERLNQIQLGHQDLLQYCEIVRCCDTPDKSLLLWRLVDHDKGEWCLEHKYSISPLQLSNNTNRIIGEQLYSYSYNGLNRDFFRSLIAEEKEVSSVDVLQGAKEGASYPFKVMAVTVYLNQSNYPVSVALCPWSSPFYGQFRLAR